MFTLFNWFHLELELDLKLKLELDLDFMLGPFIHYLGFPFRFI